MNIQELIRIAKKAREFAHAPYSNYKVGAALLTKSGKVFTGCNIENVSFGGTNCAERTAVFKAVSEGHKDFEALVVIGGNEEEYKNNPEHSGPCCLCRQVLLEFSEDMTIIIARSEDEYYVHTLSELVPYPFTPRALGQ